MKKASNNPAYFYTSYRTAEQMFGIMLLYFTKEEYSWGQHLIRIVGYAAQHVNSRIQ